MTSDTEAFCVVEGMKIAKADKNMRLPVLLIKKKIDK